MKNRPSFLPFKRNACIRPSHASKILFYLIALHAFIVSCTRKPYCFCSSVLVLHSYSHFYCVAIHRQCKLCKIIRASLAKTEFSAPQPWKLLSYFLLAVLKASGKYALAKRKPRSDDIREPAAKHEQHLFVKVAKHLHSFWLPEDLAHLFCSQVSNKSLFYRTNHGAEIDTLQSLFQFS